MSHTMNIDLQIKDANVLASACRRLKLRCEQDQTVRFYDGTTHAGKTVRLPGWQYPVVIKDDGTVAYDNYNGSWGDIRELNKLKAYYGLEKAKVEARRKGYSVREVARDGRIELRVTVG